MKLYRDLMSGLLFDKSLISEPGLLGLIEHLTIFRNCTYYDPAYNAISDFDPPPFDLYWNRSDRDEWKIQIVNDDELHVWDAHPIF